MQTSNTEEMVTISRAEYEHLQQEKARNAKLEAKFAALEQEQAQVITSLTLQNEWLLEQLKLSKKKLFGRSSEQAEQMVMEQLSLTYNELEAYAFGTKAATEKQITVKAHERKRQSGNVLDVVPEGTPTEVVEHRLPGNERTCSACGSKLVEIGKEVRRSLMMKPAEFWVREDVYYTYACKNCEQETGEANIVKAAKEPALLPGSFASAEAVAYLAAQKFVMYSPLYRLEQEFNRQGLRLSRQTMANWLLNTSEKWLRPIYDALREQLCKEPVLHADETTLQVLKEPGRSSTSKSYMWLYRTSGCTKQAIVLYEYQPTRKAEHAEYFLQGFSGWLHADGYQGYHRLPGNIRVVGCWAHARRKFDEALQTLPKEMQKDAPAAIGECYCSRLFKLEQAFAELTPEERYEKRLEQENASYSDILRSQCRVLMDYFDAVLGDGASQRLGLTGSDLGKCTQVATEFKAAIETEKAAAKAAVTVPLEPQGNRAQRRAERKHNKHKPPVSYPAAQPDKTARRKQLLAELAALENG